MLKTVKIFGLIFFFIIVLLALASLMLPLIVDTQRFREQLIEQVRIHSGQELQIKGDLSFSLLPWLGLSVREVYLAQPSILSTENSGDQGSTTSAAENWLYVQRADVKAKLLPLLQKKLVIQSIRVHKPRINYIIDSNGRASLDGFYKSSNSQNSPADEESHPPSQSSASALLIADISVVGGEIVVDDRRADRIISISDLNLEVGDLLSGGLEPINFNARLALPELPTVDIDLSSQARLDVDQQRLSLKNLSLKVDSENPRQTVELSGEQIDINYPQQLLELRQLKIESSLSGLAPVSLQPLLNIASIDIDLKKETLQPVEFSLQEKKLGIDLRGNLSARNLLQAPLYSGQFSSNQMSPKKMLKRLAIDYRTDDPSVLESLQIKSRFNGSTVGLALQKIEVNLDESRISGDFSIADFSKRLSRFEITLDALNLNRYLPQTLENANGEQKTSASIDNTEASDALFASLMAPMAAFQTLPSVGVFRATQLQVGGIQMQAINVAVNSSGREVVIKPTAELYRGSVSANLRYQPEDTGGQLKVVSEFRDVEMGPLLRDAQISDQLVGKGFIRTDLLFSEVNGKFSQSGSINLQALDGAISGAGISQMIDRLNQNLSEKCKEFREKYFLLTKKINERCRDWSDRLQSYRSDNDGSGEDKLIFTKSNADIQLDNFILNNRSLVIEAEKFFIRGRGSIDTRSQALDYQVTLDPVDLRSNNNEALPLSIPFAAKGKLPEIKFAPDYRLFFENLTEELKNLEKRRLREKLQDKLGIGESGADDSSQSTGKQLQEDLKKKLLDKLFR